LNEKERQYRLQAIDASSVRIGFEADQWDVCRQGFYRLGPWSSPPSPRHPHRTNTVAETIIVIGRYINAMKPVIAAAPMLPLARATGWELRTGSRFNEVAHVDDEREHFVGAEADTGTQGQSGVAGIISERKAVIPT
jgi:hypothetical protein